MIDVDLKTGKKLGIKIRPVGDFASKEPGDVHMERGGPEGALVFFSSFTEDGSLAETLSQECRVLNASSINPILPRHAY